MSTACQDCRFDLAVFSQLVGRQNMKLLLACVVGCFFVGALGEDQDPQNAGAYEVKLTSFETCSDPGKNFYSMEGKFDESYNVFNGVFHKKEPIGDNVKVTIDMRKQVGEEWKKEFSQNLGGVCTLIKAAPDTAKPFLEAMNIKGCPIEAGDTEIKDLKNSFLIPFMKEMVYGNREGEVTFSDEDGNTLGCFAIKGKVIPKTV